MRRTSRLIVLFGVALAVLVFVLVLFMLQPPTSTPGGSGGPNASPPPNVSVVTAAKDIPLGTVVTADMLGTTTVPSSAVVSGTYLDKSQAIGQIARQNILTGAQVGASDFALDQSIQALTVPPGRRAMSVYVSDLTGVGRLIHIGDTVDVVVTFDEATIKVLTIQPGSTTAQHDDNFRPLTVKAPVLLQNIQVIGTLQAAAPTTTTTNQQAGASPTPSAGATADQGAKKLIILAVTDSQAEALLFARAGGTIDLILRSVADASAPPVNTAGVDLKTMFQTYGVIPPYVIRAFPIYISQQQ